MLSLLRNKCPRCHKGNVFSSGNLFKLNFSGMQEECPVCHLSFSNEQGFYWGAMYVSYALTLVECVIVYVLARLAGIGVYDYTVIWPMLFIIVILAPFNFRMSRLIWLHLFKG